jgi:branched-chain amino acid aminotransferase
MPSSAPLTKSAGKPDHAARSNALKPITWFEGAWHEGDVKVMGVQSPGAWLGASVFDGARGFEGVAPDLDRHCQRAIASAKLYGMKPPVTAAEIERLAREGLAKFPKGTEVYIRPLMWSGAGLVIPDPDSTKFALTIEPMDIPPFAGFTACLSPFRRPATDMAITDAKGGSLYPNVARSEGEAKRRGFDAAIMLDPAGNVAEFASSNLFIVKDGVVATPVVNGTFLNGITRQRIIKLLSEAGMKVEERRVTFAEVMTADEVFSTGNYAKVKPCIRVEDRRLEVGPVATKARELYFAWARSGS